MGFVRLAHVRCYKHLVTTALRLTLSPLINHPPQTSSIRNILRSILVQTFIYRRSYWISGRSIMRYLFSFYADAARIALQSILAHKLRAFLTLIGIIIGVAAVVVVGASVSGLNTYVTERVAKVLGANHFMIARIAFQGQRTDDEFERMNRRNKRLNWDDYEWVRDHCTSCAEVGAESGGQVDLSQDGIEFPGAIVFGVTANMADIEDKTIEEGRFVSND